MPEKEPKNIAKTIQEYGRKVFAFIKGKVGQREDAEDILQEVWYQLSSLTDLDSIENIGAWLYTVSRNKVKDSYKKKKNDYLEDFSFINDEEEADFKDVLLLDNSQNPESALFKKELWEDILMALEKIPKNQAQVFMMNEIEDFTLQEIADQLGENIKTIISRKGYAIKNLRKILKNEYQDLEK